MTGDEGENEAPFSDADNDHEFKARYLCDPLYFFCAVFMIMCPFIRQIYNSVFATAKTNDVDNGNGTTKPQTQTPNSTRSAASALPLSPGTETATDSGFITANDGFTTAADAGWTSGFGTEFEDPASSSPLGGSGFWVKGQSPFSPLK